MTEILLPPPQDAGATYEATAPVYDRLTAHHDYELWIGNLLPELRSHGLPERGRMLDVACGTGKSFLPMLERGWEVSGVDVSAAMLDVARRKAPAVELAVADMRELGTLGSFDLVWCLDDALNYLLEERELQAAFEGFRRNLADGGLVLFDLNAVPAYRWFWAEESVIDGDPPLTWRGLAGEGFAAGGIAEAALTIGEETVVHRQRHHPHEVAAHALAAAGLELLGVHGIETDAVLRQPLDEAEHTKAIYIAAKDEGR
jgi:SAM-dependent methyltransferase